MTAQTQTQTPAATNVVLIDGTKDSWPDRLNGVEVTFPTIPQDATLEDAVAFVVDRADSEENAVAFLRSSLEKLHPATLRAWLNAKGVEEGKTYTPEERKALKQRSATATKEDVVAFGANWKIPAPRVSKVKAAISAAEAARRRSEEERDASRAAMIDILRALPKKDAQARLDSLIAAGIVPADTTL
jgi:hypothetical protein